MELKPMQEEPIKAPHAGNCYKCGGAIYVGDLIRTCDIVIIVAVHEDCLNKEKE